MKIARSLALIGALLVSSAACARHRGRSPEWDRALEEFVRDLTPEEWEQGMTRDKPACELEAEVDVSGWRAWPLVVANHTLRLPETFRADQPPREGAPASWSRADSSVVEVMGPEALMGLAVAGRGVETEPPCVIRVLGRRARVDRARFLDARAETTYFAVVTAVPAPREGWGIGVQMRTRAGRDSLLRSIAALERGPARQ